LIAGHVSGNLRVWGGHGGKGLLAPDLGSVREELEDVRRHGVGHVSEDAVPSLLAVTRQRRASTGLPLGEELGRLLAEGIAAWGEGTAAQAARCTFGLTPRTRLLAGHVGRRAAADIMGITPDHFRKTKERDLLDQLAATIVTLATEPAPMVAVPTPKTSADTGGLVRVSTLDDEDDYSLRGLIDEARTVPNGCGHRTHLVVIWAGIANVCVIVDAYSRMIVLIQDHV
jgi:hypothetical protein